MSERSGPAPTPATSPVWDRFCQWLRPKDSGRRAKVSSFFHMQPGFMLCTMGCMPTASPPSPPEGSVLGLSWGRPSPFGRWPFSGGPVSSVPGGEQRLPRGGGDARPPSPCPQHPPPRAFLGKEPGRRATVVWRAGRQSTLRGCSLARQRSRPRFMGRGRGGGGEDVQGGMGGGGDPPNWRSSFGSP